MGPNSRQWCIDIHGLELLRRVTAAICVASSHSTAAKRFAATTDGGRGVSDLQPSIGTTSPKPMAFHALYRHHSTISNRTTSRTLEKLIEVMMLPLTPLRGIPRV